MNIVCKDINGNLLEKLYQWDIGVKIVMTGIETSSLVDFHITNDPCGTAIVAEGIESDDGYTVDIPDELLREDSPIIMYIYEHNEDGDGRTISLIAIPVIHRAKPSGYTYEDSAVYLSYQKLRTDLDALSAKVDVLAEMVESLSQEAI